MKYFLLSIACAFVLHAETAIAQNQSISLHPDKSEIAVSHLSLDTATHSMMQPQHFRNPWRIHRQVGQYGLLGTYVATVVGAAAMEDEFAGTTVIPIAGPFITILRIEDDPNAFYQPGGRPLLIAAGVSQSAFLAYFVTSLIGERSYRNRQRQAQFSVAPMMNGTGVSMNIRF